MFVILGFFFPLLHRLFEGREISQPWNNQGGASSLFYLSYLGLPCSGRQVEYFIIGAPKLKTHHRLESRCTRDLRMGFIIPHIIKRHLCFFPLRASLREAPSDQGECRGGQAEWLPTAQLRGAGEPGSRAPSGPCDPSPPPPPPAALVRKMFQIQPELLSVAQETSGKFSPSVWKSTYF